MTSYNKTALETPSLTTQLKESLKIVKHQVEVNSREEGKAVEKALANPVTKAIVVVEGVLADLTEEQQKRVLKFVTESLGVITGD